MITPEQFRAARLAAGLSQSQCAKLLHRCVRTISRFETGRRQRIDPAVYDLLLEKTGQKETKE